ncbi:MAG TPA: divalent-cation tolerance protein CutA [Haliangium sp.]|nr:divalent-cation tolerance protein CutA [Haliangium sp.]
MNQPPEDTFDDPLDEGTDEPTDEFGASNSYVMVQVTTASPDEAEKIARAAVDGGLASSAQIAPVRTRYRWQGASHEASEQLITMYTRLDRFNALADCVRAHHSYDVPQIVALPVIDATASFLRWIDESTLPDDDEPEKP